ncbi:hypothetical protein BDW71DRAFT_2611 [Aspergillus fruticulosus]
MFHHRFRIYWFNCLIGLLPALYHTTCRAISLTGYNFNFCGHETSHLIGRNGRIIYMYFVPGLIVVPPVDGVF